MVKAYLRYEFASAFGVVTSGAPSCYDASGKLLITSALENVVLWNLKQGTQVKVLAPAQASTSAASAAAEVTCITRAPGNSSQIAVGYSDGTVRLWDIDYGECMVTLKGHKSGVTCLRFSPGGSLLFSGSRDTELIVWDVLGETGLFRLRGHKDQITDLAYLSSGSGGGVGGETDNGYLVSSSKDGFIRVWDLGTQHCCQTLGGHKAEVWALDVNPQQTRLVSGSTDHELRVYRIALPDGQPHTRTTTTTTTTKAATAGTAAAATAESASGSGREPVLHYMGSVKRQAAGHDRVAGLRYDVSGALLAVQAAGKAVELFKVRSEEEALKKLKRRKKRRREKVARKASRKASGAGPGPQGAEASSSEEEEEEEGDGEGSSSIKATDELESFQVVSSKHKVRSICWAPATALAARKKALAPSAAPATGGDLLGQLSLCLSNNSVEVVDVRGEGYDVAQRLELGGHRGDVRAVTLSADDQLLASASNAALKVWNPRTGACLSTIESGYGLSLLFAPGNRHAVMGTKEGTLEVFDLGAAERVHVEAAHEGAVWSLAPLPDKSGFVSGSADKSVKFWQWSVSVGRDGVRHLRLAHVRTLRMADDVLNVKVSPDGKLLAVALLDSTVKVFYTDSLKFFLSLYGHKLPVMSMDISSDSTLLATASADKNIKVWGLDFGDCHKSLFAHGDAVMGVTWVPGTHYAFSVGKDRQLKYWDLDRFELLLELPGHHSEVWAVAVSGAGDFVVSAGHDRSLRRWERTTEPFFIEEEKEKRLESLFESDLGDNNAGGGIVGAAGGAAGADEEGGASAAAGRRTLDGAGAADALVDALEVSAHESERQQEARAAPGGEAPAPNPLMLGLSPSAYVLKALVSVRPPDLESCLLMLPFTDALRLMTYLPLWLDQGAGQHAELVGRVAVLLLRLHHTQLVATPSARPVLLRLRGHLRPTVQGLKDVLGFNMAALQHLQRSLRERRGVNEAAGVLPAKRALGKA